MQEHVGGWTDRNEGDEQACFFPLWTPEGPGVQTKHFVGCGFEEFEESLSRPCQP